jgi:hypothetical protein
MRPNPFIPGGNLFSKGACRAIGDALTARDAGRFAQRLTIVGDHDAPVSTLRDSQDMMALDLAAGPNAPPTENTSIEIHSDERVRVVDRKRSPLSGEAAAGKMMTFGEGMQLAPTPLLIGQAIDRMIRQQQLDHKPAGLDSLFGFGQDLHPFRRRDRASGPQVDSSVLGNLYQAHSTAWLRWKRWDLTECRDGDP